MKYIIITIVCAIAIFIGVYVFKQYSNKDVANIPHISQGDLEKAKQYAAQEAAQNPTVQQKGNEALLKYNILSLRAEAEKILTANGGYQSLCKNEVLNNAILRINTHVSELLKMEDVTDQNSAGIVCVSSSKSYVVSIQVNPPKMFQTVSWCVDSTGYVGKGLADREKLVCNKK